MRKVWTMFKSLVLMGGLIFISVLQMSKLWFEGNSGRNFFL